MFLYCQLFSSKSGIYEAKRKPRDLITIYILQVPGSLASGLTSLCSLDFPYVCLLYNVWGFELCLVGRIGEKMSVSFPRKQKAALWPDLKYEGPFFVEPKFLPRSHICL